MELPKRKEVPELLRSYRDIRHSYSVFGVDELTLLDDDTATGNSGLEAVGVELFEVHVIGIYPMREQ